jgi:hypothetical protein
MADESDECSHFFPNCESAVVVTEMLGATITNKRIQIRIRKRTSFIHRDCLRRVIRVLGNPFELKPKVSSSLNQDISIALKARATEDTISNIREKYPDFEGVLHHVDCVANHRLIVCVALSARSTSTFIASRCARV